MHAQNAYAYARPIVCTKAHAPTSASRLTPLFETAVPFFVTLGLTTLDAGSWRSFLTTTGSVLTSGFFSASSEGIVACVLAAATCCVDGDCELLSTRCAD